MSRIAPLGSLSDTIQAGALESLITGCRGWKSRLPNWSLLMSGVGLQFFSVVFGYSRVVIVYYKFPAVLTARLLVLSLGRTGFCRSFKKSVSVGLPGLLASPAPRLYEA